MSESRAAGWPSGSPTAAQLKEFFAQIESRKISKERLQSFLRPPANNSSLISGMDIWELELTVRPYNILKRIGIDTIGDLVEKSEDELKTIPNMGVKSIVETKERLAEHSLALKSAAPQPAPLKAEAILTFDDYKKARGDLDQLCQDLGVWAGLVPVGAIEHANAAVEILGDVPADGNNDNIPIKGVLQSARNHLLIVRELFAERYDSLPAPDRLIRLCDSALKGVPGEGEQTHRPYE